MSALTDETKLSRALQNGLNCIGLNNGMVVFSFIQNNAEYQKRMMDLILAFLSVWADKFKQGYVEEGDALYNLCHMAYCMVESCAPSKHGDGIHHRAP